VTDDLKRSDLDELDWSSPQRSAALSTVFAHAVGLASNAEAWYARKRPAKRYWGRALRVGALLLGTAAAVLPILAEISTTNGKPAIPPGWSAVALALAAALIALDRYFGFSNGWMRFMEAELRVTRLRHDFEYEWNAQRSLADPPGSAEIAALLELARELVLAVDDIVAEETSGWITEFRGSLERAEKGLSPQS
jgi:hypothetical protein